MAIKGWSDWTDEEHSDFNDLQDLAYQAEHRSYYELDVMRNDLQEALELIDGLLPRVTTKEQDND